MWVLLGRSHPHFLCFKGGIETNMYLVGCIDTWWGSRELMHLGRSSEEVVSKRNLFGLLKTSGESNFAVPQRTVQLSVHSSSHLLVYPFIQPVTH